MANVSTLLYEAGSSKSVTFSRVGVSYIFCNIHPEMSAVVISLATPLSGVADSSGSFFIKGMPAGTYKLSLWIEGVPQPTLDSFSRTVHLPAGTTDLGELHIEIGNGKTQPHTNEFGMPYDRDKKSSY